MSPILARECNLLQQSSYYNLAVIEDENHLNFTQGRTWKRK